MKTKLLILIFTILICVAISFVFFNNTKADTGGTLYPQTYPIGCTAIFAINGVEIGSTTATTSNAITGEITANINVASPLWLNTGETLTVSYKDFAGTLLRTDSLASGAGYIAATTLTAHFNVYTSEEYTNDDGSTWSIDYALYDSGTYLSGLSFTTYFYVTVNSAYGSPTSSQWVTQGGSLVASVTSPETLSAGIRLTCTGNNIDGAGYTSHTFTNVQSALSITFNWQLQYQVIFSTSGLDGTAIGTVLTYNSATYTYSTLPAVWVNANTYISFTYSDGITSTVEHKKFYITGTTSSPQYISGPTTISDTYALAYYQAYVTFSHTGLNSSATGIVLSIYNVPPYGPVWQSYLQNALPKSFWVDIGSTVAFTYSTTVTSSISHCNYIFLGSNYATGTTIYSDTTIIGTYSLTAYEALVTFATSGLDSSAQGTVVTVNGEAKTYAQLPYSFYATIGSSVSFTYATSITSSSYEHQRFILTSGYSSPITISSTTTITDTYTLSYFQYQVIVNHSGLDSSAQGTVVTVNGEAKTYIDLPYSFWVDPGTQVTFSYATTVTSTTAHQKFYLTSFSESPRTINSDTTISASYSLNYYQAAVTFNPSGINSSATGTIATVNSVAVTYASLPYITWVDIGSQITFTYENNVASNIEHYQFVLTNTYSSPQTITGTTSLNAVYVLSAYQALITFTTSGLDSTAQGAVMTINGVPKTYSNLPYSFYANLGDTVIFSYPTTIASTVTHEHQQFVLVSGYTSPLTVTGTTTITITYALVYYQYNVTITQVGLDSSAQGTIVAVNGVAKAWSDLSSPYIFWVNQGSSLTYTYSSTITSSTTGKQFVSYYTTPTTTITVNNNIIISNTYTTQYYLDIITPYSSGLISGWYNYGATVSCTVAQSTVEGTANTRYVFASWSGSGSGSYTGTNVYPTTIIMNAPITETAIWNTQYYVSIVGVYSATTGSGWYNSGASASFSITSPVAGGTGSQLAFTSWTGSGSGSYTGATLSSSCTVNAPITETANWITQYYLTITSSYGTTTGSGWYNTGATAYAGLNTNTTSGGTGKQYIFVSWSTGGTNATQSAAITMSFPVTATATWATQYYLTVSSPYGLPTSGTAWYNTGATAYATVTTNIDGSHILQGWSADASGTGITSSAITMTAPKLALAVWSTIVTPTPIGPTASPSPSPTPTATPPGQTPTPTPTASPTPLPAYYYVTLIGPLFEDAPDTMAAGGNTVRCLLTYTNGTIADFTMTSTVGTPGTLSITSSTPFVQLTWNASSTSATYNGTRTYRFANGANGINDQTVRIFIVHEDKPANLYTFSISDYYGMTAPYLETSISPDGTTNYIVERINLEESGGYVTFVMQQYQMYTLHFVCAQGTYSPTFTAATIGTPGQLPYNLNVLAGNFAATTTSTSIVALSQRINATHIISSYSDATSLTSWVYILISHQQGTTTIYDYTNNATGNTQLFTWEQAESTLDYNVNIQSLSNGTLYTWNFAASITSTTNPWDGVLDFLGTTTNTLPVTYTGWGGIDPAQLIAAALIMAALGIGSFYSTTASMVVAWAIAGILLKLGWWQGSAPLFVLAMVFTALVAIDEYKKGAINI
jgi:hypothetical protein